MVTLETGGAQQVDKRRDDQLSFLICDSKLDKPVNDLNLDLSRTWVRLPPGPPFNENELFPYLILWRLFFYVPLITFL